MANNRSMELLTFAGAQMAAEGVWTDLPPRSNSQFEEVVLSRLTAGNGHTSKFPATLAIDWMKDWDVVAHQENTSTGFSGTLFRAKRTDLSRGLVAGEYTL
jgi:hypothetical protein